MADPNKTLHHNRPGDFYVDSTCIDCDTCRSMLPRVFGRREEQASILEQPEGPEEGTRALMALLSCPTASIGTRKRHDLAAAFAGLPDPILPGVHHCGFHDEKSYGATSYLIVRPEGNVLVDVPRFTRRLLGRIEEMGGVDLIFLSHRDDVGDHEKWARHFGAERLMHEADIHDGIRGIERPLSGFEDHRLAPDLLVIPTPGHSRGSLCLLHRDEVLFSGDHLAYSVRLGHLHAFREYLWDSWERQIESVRRLLDHRFSWVLPGHGRRFRTAVEDMPAEIRRCLDWMIDVS